MRLIRVWNPVSCSPMGCVPSHMAMMEPVTIEHPTAAMAVVAKTMPEDADVICSGVADEFSMGVCFLGCWGLGRRHGHRCRHMVIGNPISLFVNSLTMALVKRSFTA